MAGVQQTTTISDEVLDFLLSSPTLKQITEFHASDALQERLGELLDKNRNTKLSVEEESELDEMEQMDHLITLLKARAFMKLATQDAVHP